MPNKLVRLLKLLKSALWTVEMPVPLLDPIANDTRGLLIDGCIEKINAK